MEKDIAEIDSNFKSREIDGRELDFYDGFEPPSHWRVFPIPCDPEGRRSRLRSKSRGPCVTNRIWLR